MSSSNFSDKKKKMSKYDYNKHDLKNDEFGKFDDQLS
jgi:hypothetical protein